MSAAAVAKKSEEGRERRALRAFVQLTRAAERVAAELQPRLTEAGLTASQLGVLEAISEDGAMSQRQLGTRLFRSGPNMTIVIDNLERDNLVRRTRSETDRRVVLVSLTKEGKRRFEEAFPAYSASVTEFMSGLTTTEQENLTRLCSKLRELVSIRRAAMRRGAMSGGAISSSQPAPRV